jgi:hypothetical protein
MSDPIEDTKTIVGPEKSIPVKFSKLTTHWPVNCSVMSKSAYIAKFNLI